MRWGRGKRWADDRVYTGAVAVDGTEAMVGVVAGQGLADAGRLIALDVTRTELLGDKLAQIEELVERSGQARVRWIGAITGGAAYHETVRVPREVQGASLEHREIACLAGTNWSDPRETDALGLAVAVQFTGTLCHIAAAPVDAAAAALSCLSGRDAFVTTEAIAFVELLRGVHPDLFSPGAPANLALLCSRATVSLVIVHGGEVVLLRQVTLDDARDATAREDRPEYAPDDEFQSPADPEASWKKRAVPRDLANAENSVWQAALFRVIRQTLELYREQGGFPGEIARVYVTGAATDTRELTTFLQSTLGIDLDVIELEGSRVVTSNDVEVAEHVASDEPQLAPLFALLAAARRPDLLAYRAGDGAEDGGSATPARATLPWRVAVRPGVLAGTALCALIASAGVGGRAAWVARERVDLEFRMGAEQARAEQLRAVTAERDANEARLRHTRELLAGIDAIRDRQRAPVELLDQIVSLLPGGARLTEVTLDADQVLVAGESANPDDASRFALAMQSSERFSGITPQTEVSLTPVPPDGENGEPVPGLRPVVKFIVRARFASAAPSEAERRITVARAGS